MMSIQEMVEVLIEREDINKCDDENCDENPPYTGCKGCSAARALNEAAEILREAVKAQV